MMINIFSQEKKDEMIQGNVIQEEMPEIWNIFSEDKNIDNLIYERTIQIPTIENWFSLPKEDPFYLTYNDFKSLPIDEVKNMYNIVHTIFKKELYKKWKEGYKHVIICNRKFEFLTKDYKDIDNKIVDSIAKDKNSACYVFSAPDIVEESNWTPVAGDDVPYPTLCIYIGAEEETEENILKKTNLC